MSIHLMLPLLFLLGLVTGFIGTNTGGSALVTVPTMIWLGISPQSAIASARVASVGTMFAGLRQFHKQGKVDYRLAFKTSLLGMLGAAIGAYLLVYVPENLMEKAVGILTLFLLAVSVLQKRIKPVKSTKSDALKTYLGYVLFVFAGMLGGFFGGQAIIATYVFLLCFNKSMSESVGTRKVNGLLVSLVAILIYGFHQLVNWAFSVSLILGTLIGATFGAKYALKKGDKWMENIFNIAVTLLALRMVF